MPKIGGEHPLPAADIVTEPAYLTSAALSNVDALAT